MVDIRLTQEEEEQLQAAGQQIAALRKTIQQMKRAGLDVTAEEEQLEYAENLRKGFLREFGTSRSRGGGATRPR